MDFGPLGPMLAQLLGGQTDAETAPPVGTPSDAMSENEGTVQGWAPKKRSTLGFLGDVLLGAFGAKPAFGQRMEQRNIQDAMEGFTQDPMESIRRLSRIKGHEKEAFELLNQQQDNARADAVARRQQTVAQEQGYNRIGSMLGAVTNSRDPVEQYKRVLPTLRRYSEAYGIDPASLPDEYDPSIIDTYRMGSMKVNEQEDNLRDEYYDNERLKDYDEAEVGRNNRHSMDESGRNAREAYRQDRMDARTSSTQDRIDGRSKKPGAKGKSAPMKDGEIRYDTDDKSTATKARMMKGGKTYLLRREGNDWKVFKVL